LLNIFINVNEVQSSRLRSMFRTRRQDYVGSPFLDEYMFDVELVETVFQQMKRGKVAGLNELTIEHLVNSHPVLVAIISKFLQRAAMLALQALY